jgi:hypothetical protein
MKKVFPFIICVFLLGISCSEKSTELTEEQKTTIQNEVNNEFEKLVNSIQQLNYDSWSELYSKNDFISSAKFSTGLLTDFNAWMDSAKISFSLRERQKTEILNLKITPLTQDMALLNQIAIWENWFKNGDYFKSYGVASYIYKKEPDGWKIVHITETGEILEEKLVE